MYSLYLLKVTTHNALICSMKRVKCFWALQLSLVWQHWQHCVNPHYNNMILQRLRELSMFKQISLQNLIVFVPQKKSKHYPKGTGSFEHQ